jgi:cytoskeleton protein RodZ
MSPVGQHFAEERRRQHRSLEDVAEATRVMRSHLDSLEHERWDALPAPAYVRGFIHAYSAYLGLDPAEMLAEYAQDVRGAASPSIELMPAKTLVPRREQAHAVPSRVWLLLAIAALVIGIGSWAISGLTRTDDTPPPIAPEATTTVEPTATTPGVVEPTESAPAEAPPPAEVAGESFTITVTADEGVASWIRVTVDGLKAFEGTLAGGATKEWVVSDSATVRVGKPATVTVARDGTPVDLPTSGGIAEVTLTASE